MRKFAFLIVAVGMFGFAGGTASADNNGIDCALVIEGGQATPGKMFQTLRERKNNPDLTETKSVDGMVETLDSTFTGPSDDWPTVGAFIADKCSVGPD